MKENQDIISTDKQQNLREEIVDLIKQRIIDGELNPGDRIVETKLARELGTSQTPIREAIRQLAGEGILNIIPNKGPVIRSLSAKDVFEIYSLRSILEGLAIRLAVQNATMNDIKHLENFYSEMKKKLVDETVESLSQDSSYVHHYILKLSKHSFLLFMYELISFRIMLVNRILCRKFNKEKEVEEHQELIEVLKKGDPDEAEKVIRAHIHRSYREFLDFGMFDTSEPVLNDWI